MANQAPKRPKYIFANENYRQVHEVPEKAGLLEALKSEAPNERRDAIGKLGRFFSGEDTDKILELVEQEDEDDKNRRLARSWIDYPQYRTIQYDLQHHILYPQHKLGRSLELLEGKVPAILVAITKETPGKKGERAISLSTKQRHNLGIEYVNPVGKVTLESPKRTIRNVQVQCTNDIDEMNSPGIILTESLAKALDMGVGEQLHIHSKNGPAEREGYRVHSK